MRALIADRGTGEPISLGAALLAGKKVAADVTRLLMEDHRVVRGWFAWYAREEDPETRAQVALAICAALRAHMAAEEEIFYPMAGERTGLHSEVKQLHGEHDDAKPLIDAIERAPDESAEEMRQLQAAIEQHVAEEETVLFPALRDTDLDLYAVGRLVAARRVERLFVLTGKGTDMKEMPEMTVSPDVARDLFITGLKNAHAVVSQSETMAEANAKRVENYPQLKDKIEWYVTEKQEQRKRLENVLESMGESPSSFKDMTLAARGVIGNMLNAMAGDEIIKDSFGMIAMTQYAAASLETLLLMGEAAGETDSLKPLQQCLAEEREMGSYLKANLRAVGLRYMQLRSEGEQASH